MSEPIAISLLVCTRNRAAAVPALLASITRAAAAAPTLAIEVVLVDNGSTDATPAILTEWCAQQAFPARVLTEPRPGLARARNHGLAAVTGAIVALTDDDCVLHAGYFDALQQCFAEHAGPAIIGGRILPGDPADLPVTLKLEDHPMEALPGSFPGGFVMGANLAFTRCVPRTVGRFDERFGAGAPFVAAEDTDFLFRAMRHGIALRYDPRFVVDHHHGRRLVEEETQLLAGYSFGDGALYAKHLFADRRTLSALREDVVALLRDFRDPVTAHRGIRHFYRFRLLHKARGAFAFLAYRLRRG